MEELIAFPTGREEGECALKGKATIKGQKADTCGVGLGNNETNMDESGCQSEYLCIQNHAGRNLEEWWEGYSLLKQSYFWNIFYGQNI